MKHPLDSPNPSFSTSWEESWFSSARLSEKTFDRKRFWLTVGVVAVVEALLFCLVFQWKYLFPSDEVSDIYTRYENVEGLDVSYIKNYRINDTVFADVTLLETKDSVVWDCLCEDFGIPLFSMYPKEYREIMSPEHSYGLKVITDTAVIEQKEVYYRTLIIFSQIKKSMCLFQDISDLQYSAIIKEKSKEITY
jgi:hypothetical protein